MTLDECKRRHILASLIRHKWRKTKVVAELDIAYSTLFRYMNIFGLPLDRPMSAELDKYEASLRV